jgi:hypothetical protein
LKWWELKVPILEQIRTSPLAATSRLPRDEDPRGSNNNQTELQPATDPTHWLNQQPEDLSGEDRSTFSFVPEHVTLQAPFLLDYLSDEVVVETSQAQKEANQAPRGTEQTSRRVEKADSLAWSSFSF